MQTKRNRKESGQNTDNVVRYWEFIEALERVDQVEERKDKITSKVHGRRLLGKHFLTFACFLQPTSGTQGQGENLVASRYVKRLMERAERKARTNSCETFTLAAGLDRPAIRFGTFKFLTSRREDHFNSSAAAMSLATLILYAYNIWSQYSGISSIQDDMMIKNSSSLSLHAWDRSWVDCAGDVPIHYHCKARIQGCGLGCLLAISGNPSDSGCKRGTWFACLHSIGSVLGLAAFDSFFCVESFNHMANDCDRRPAYSKVRESKFEGLQCHRAPPRTAGQTFCINATAINSHQHGKIVGAKPRFTLILVEAPSQIILNSQHMVLEDVCDVLRDINENRLNKFELALSLIKLQERLLDDDIQ
eukprot:764539-Hanusia_phi.AAC.4